MDPGQFHTKGSDGIPWLQLPESAWVTGGRRAFHINFNSARVALFLGPGGPRHRPLDSLFSLAAVTSERAAAQGTWLVADDPSGPLQLWIVDGCGAADARLKFRIFFLLFQVLLGHKIAVRSSLHCGAAGCAVYVFFLK